MKKLLLSVALLGFAFGIGGAPSVSAAAPVPTLTRVNYLSFLNHYVAYNAKISADLDDWQFYSDWDDYDGMASVDLRERNHARTEMKWINAHKPTSSCFTKLYAAHKTEVHYTDLAAGYMYRFHALGDLNAADLAITYLDKSTAAYKNSTKILKATHC